MATASKHSILLVDDEPEILFSLRGLLRREYDLHTAKGVQKYAGTLGPYQLSSGNGTPFRAAVSKQTSTVFCVAQCVMESAS